MLNDGQIHVTIGGVSFRNSDGTGSIQNTGASAAYAGSVNELPSFAVTVEENHKTPPFEGIPKRCKGSCPKRNWSFMSDSKARA